ncbi:MAG: universal stress protein, partial [Actinomycetota bacterium]|nr:universal stress protein [Actinomycetota bacterium]
LTGAHLVVMSVDSVHQAEATPEFFDEQADKLTARLYDWIAEADLDGVEVDPVLRAGRPADVIEAETEATSPDLVVVGARGSGGFTRLGLGSTTHRLAHSTRVPLAAVHERSALGPGTALLVGVDGSPGSEVALEWAAQLARLLSTEPTAVFVSDPMADSYPHPQSGTAKFQRKQDAEDVIAKVVERTGIQIKLQVEPGNATEVLADLATQTSSSIVVVGTRSHGLTEGHVLGRVPMQLLHHCAQPVVLVPHPSS